MTNPQQPPPAMTSPFDRRSPRLSRPRIEPVLEADWTVAQQRLLAPHEQSGRPYNVFTTLANHPNLARDWLTFAAHILRRNTLPPRDRELLILRVGCRCDSAYEWVHHLRIGRSEGLNDDDFRRAAADPTAPVATEKDRLLLQAVDELLVEAMISDETWRGLATFYDQQQLMDLVFTVGQYNLVSMALNSFGVQLDEGLAPLPPAIRGVGE